jgi:glycerate-2-kinase
MTRASFDAGRALLRFVDAHDDVLFLISGGGSACVEVALAPHDEAELIETNARLIASGKAIGEINAVRKQLSAIKGGRLGQRVRGRQVSLVYSDVSSGRPEDVASGPTEGRELVVIADNTTLVDAAASLAQNAIVIREQLEGDVQRAAGQLAAVARQLERGQLLIAGGEPTVVVRGSGKGGRCSELALRFARELAGWNGAALFAASDGVDGNSGAAGIVLRKFPSSLEADAAFARSDSWPLAAQLGEPIMIAPTGNNLRDLFLVARG